MRVFAENSVSSTLRCDGCPKTPLSWMSAARESRIDVGEIFPDIGRSLPDMGEIFPDFGETLPDIGGSLPDIGGNIPDVGEILPDIGGSLPDVGEILLDFGETLPDIGVLNSTHERARLQRKPDVKIL